MELLMTLALYPVFSALIGSFDKLNLKKAETIIQK